MKILCLVTLMLCLLVKASAHSAHFYMRPKASQFLQLAVKHDTDKVSMHDYNTLYAKYFEMMGKRYQVKKLMEIGLGCNMNYGPGHSAALWREFMPQAEIWMAEFNADCVNRHMDKLKPLNIKPLIGDQADVPTLLRWVRETDGGFDVIIDDGGHSNMQMYNSFVVLFEKALNPGGIYIIEDLLCAREGKYIDGDTQHITVDVIKDWLEGLMMTTPGYPVGPGAAQHQRPYTPKFKLPPRLKSIDCQYNACAFIKCFADDPKCTSLYTNSSGIAAI